MLLHCKKCQAEVNTIITQSGPHIKATCWDCGAYIKFLKKKELKAHKEAIEAQLDRPLDKVA